jgi:nucleotide-binding universal stress UspA family protein
MNIILFSVDASFSVSVTALTGKLAQSLNANFTLAYISSSNDKEAGEFILNNADSLLEGLDVEKIYQSGESMEEIMALIEEGEYDIVVFEDRRRRGFFATEQDNLVQKVIQCSPTSVLLVRQMSNKFERMMICSGGTEISEPAIELGAKIASKLEMETSLLHVEGTVPTIYNLTGVKEERLKNILGEETPLAKHLGRCEEIFSEHGLEVKKLIEHGVVDETIIDTAHQEKIDLVVLGASWSRKKLAGFLMGDITKELIKRMGSAILIVKV